MSKFCTGCGAVLEDDKKFCTACGASVNETPAETVRADPPHPQAPPPPSPPPPPPVQPQTAPVYAQTAAATVPPPAAPQPTYQPTAVGGADGAPPKGSKYGTITTGGFIGIALLMCIPVLGLLLTIIWACGGCRKITKRNLARASLIMMLVGLIISMILGFAFKSLFGKVISTLEEETGISITETTGSERGTGGSLSGLLGLFGGQSGEGGTTNSDIEELNGLGQLLNGLGALTGEETGLEGLLSGAVAANKDAEAANDGWPKSLRKYPGGKAVATASYRTEISGTTREEMMKWIEDLKGDGFRYQDFYDFGMSEQDMLDMNGWWAYDGKTYLSVSYSEGKVIVDHTKELPDLASYFN